MPERKVKKAKKEEEAPNPKHGKQEEPKQEDDPPLPHSNPMKRILGDPKEVAKAHKEKRQKKEPNDPEEGEVKADKEKRKKMKMKRRKKEEEKKVGVKEKKAYDLPGQKHDTPDERDPLRIFYETLYQQLPDNEMAAVWMMEWGLLSPDEAAKIYHQKLKKIRKQKRGSPIDSVAIKKTPDVSVKNRNEAVSKAALKTKKRKVNDCSVDDDGYEDDYISVEEKIKKKNTQCFQLV